MSEVPDDVFDAMSSEVVEVHCDLEGRRPEDVVLDQRGSMLAIALHNMRIEVDLDWLLSVLPGAARRQVEEASLIIVTDPNGRLCKVLKCTCGPGDYLEMHTSIIG